MGVVLSWRNEVEVVGASLTVSSEASGLGARSLLTPQIQDIWRSASWGTTPVTIDIDLGSAKVCNLVAIAFPRDGLAPITSSTVNIKASATAIGVSNTVDSTSPFTAATNPWGVWAYRNRSNFLARVIRLTFTGGAGNPYLQLGRVWVGKADASLITTYNHGYGQTSTFADPGREMRAAITGARYSTVGLPYRIENVPMPILTSAEAVSIRTAASIVGTTGQVFFAKDDTDLNDGMFGQFAEIPRVVRSLENLWTTDFQIEEDA